MTVSLRSGTGLYFVDEREVSSIDFHVNSKSKFVRFGEWSHEIENHHLIIGWKLKTGEETVLSWKLTSDIEKSFLDDALYGKIGSDETLHNMLSSRALSDETEQILYNLKILRGIIESKKLPVLTGVLD